MLWGPLDATQTEKNWNGFCRYKNIGEIQHQKYFTATLQREGVAAAYEAALQGHSEATPPTHHLDSTLT